MRTSALHPSSPSGCPFAGRQATAGPPVSREPVARPSGCRGRRGAPDGADLARDVIAVVRRTGKHFLPGSLLDRLAEIRADLPAVHDPRLAAFLEGILDKHDGRFQNRTYLALPLLEQLLDDGLDPDRLAALLMADVIRFEERAAQAAPHRGPDDDRPDPRTLRTRLQHARRFVEHCGGSHEPTPAVAGWLDATVAPVHVRHDEYFFIRALQCHELTFTVLTDDVRAATRALRQGSVRAASAHLVHAVGVFERAALLFRIVATMRASTFHTFREFTEGASAIQSDAYKRFEAACGSPDPARLVSDAFAGVPAVRAEVRAGQDTFCRAYLDAQRDRTPAWDALDAAVGDIERSHQRWKTTHRALAARMLGDARGSGYTSGVPYLEKCLQNRLFRPLTDVRAAAA